MEGRKTGVALRLLTRPWGIRTRILGAVLLPALLGATVLLVLFARDRAASLEKDVARDVERVAWHHAEQLREAMARRDYGALAAVTETVLGSAAVERVTLRESTGTLVLTASDNPRRESFLAHVGVALAVAITSRDLRPTAAVIPLRRPETDTAPIGILVIQPSRAHAGQLFLASLLPSIAFTVALLLVAALVALVTANSLISPLKGLIRHTQRLESGELDVQVRTGSPAELGDLERATNHMAHALDERRRALRHQVRETTSELRQTLQAVEVQNVELDVARKRALEASKVKSEFLANVSHEVRTPINGIVGFADLLFHSPLDAEQRDYVNTIRESCNNLLTIVNDILDFSKIEAGKLVIDNVAFDLRDSVEEVLSLLAPAAYGKSLELIHLIYADVPLKLYGDPIRIRQVLTNLVHNAIKFTPTGRIVVRVMLEDATHRDAALRITVSDTGIGLSGEDQTKLFTAFSQADTSLTRRFGGTGLGLIISRKLLDQMGGDIGLESVVGEGSTFWFTLRLPRQPSSRRGDSGQWKNPLAGKRALLLDDEPLSRLALGHLLTAWEMHVQEASDRQSFLSLAAAGRRWDVAIVGLARSELNSRIGRDALATLRRGDMPLMIMASTVDRNELRSLYQHGASVCLPKAIRRQTVFRELCRLIAPDSAPAIGRRDEETVFAADTLPSHRGSRVLVVDDNGINRKLVSTIVSRAGASVTEANDGRSAVDACRDRHFDVIFMDIHMPGMSGETAIREIKRIYGREATPRIVALTANAMEGERDRLMDEAGVDDCLIKPVTDAQLLAAIRGEAPSERDDGEARKSSDTALHVELRRALIAELPEDRRAIRRAYRANVATDLRDAVHRLNGAASVCHLPELRNACDELERAIASGERASVPPLMEHLMEEIAALLSPDADRSHSPARPRNTVGRDG